MRHLTLHTLGALALTASVATPMLAETVGDCQDRVIFECDQALKQSNWVEKVAVGIACTAMYAACGGVVINVRLI